MSWLRFLRRNRLDARIADDILFHIESETGDNLARGMPPAEARAAALRKFGNPCLIREEVYRMNTLDILESAWQDLRYACRAIRQNPAFAATAVLTLALGIGGNTAIFTVVRSVVLKPLDYRDPGRLVKVAESDPNNPSPVTVDFTTTYDLRTGSRSFESLSLYRSASAAFVEQGQPELIDGLRVNYDYFHTLGVNVQLGRAFLPEEDHPDRRHEAILTHELWMRRFGGDPHILGRDLRLSDASFLVVGVLPAGFRPLPHGGASAFPEIYMPLGYALGERDACRGCQHLQLIGRLKPGVSVERARAELNSVMAGIARAHPAEYPRDIAISVTPLREFLVGRVATAMWILLGGVGLVLLIACANVANLVLARATGRSKEMAMRAALGATRARMVRQLLSEYLLLAAAGGLAGLLLAWRGTAALAAFASRQLPRADEIHMDAAVLWFTLAISLLTVALFGAAPALGASRANCSDALKDMGRSTAGRPHHTLRNLLVAAELAMAFVLVMGAGLLGRSFLRLMDVNPGYDPHNVLTCGVYVYGPRYQNPETELDYYGQAMTRLRAVPGVESAAMVSTLPLGSFDRRGFHVQDRPLANTADAPHVDTYSISPDYFRVMRIPLKRGRGFTAQDRKGAPRVAIVSESCARLQFPNQDPIGKHIQLGGRDDKREWLTIVGIVGDIRQYSLDRPPDMEAYIAQAQDVSFGYSLVARTTLDPLRLQNAAREAFLSVDRTQPIYHVRPMEAYVRESLATRSFTLALLALFGALALILAAVGIYGVISYAVTLRTREVGIRMALGAAGRDVLAMVLRRSFTLIAAGLAAGFLASLALTRFLGTLLFEVRSTDVATSSVVAVALAGIALMASYLPARRATRIDPVSALRVG
jgi:putative ABC transport system permease protein